MKTDPPSFTVGDLVRGERSKRRLSQEALAAKAGVHPMTVHNVEAGKVSPNFATLRRLAAALGCSLDQLTPPEPLAAA